MSYAGLFNQGWRPRASRQAVFHVMSSRALRYSGCRKIKVHYFFPFLFILWTHQPVSIANIRYNILCKMFAILFFLFFSNFFTWKCMNLWITALAGLNHLHFSCFLTVTGGSLCWRIKMITDVAQWEGSYMDPRVSVCMVIASRALSEGLLPLLLVTRSAVVYCWNKLESVKTRFSYVPA